MANNGEMHTLNGTPLKSQVDIILRGLQECRQKRLYTDVVLCAGDEEFPCHKVVLAASSRYFKAMFLTPFSEQQTSRVCLDHVSPWALLRLIDFTYTGNLSLSTSVVQDVFVAANLLDYPLAIQACTDFMRDHLEISNCLGVEMLAEAYDFPGLARSAHKIAIENFPSLVQTDDPCAEWLQLSLANVQTYLAADDLEIRSEQTVLGGCLAWVSYDPEKRLQHLPDLLRHVRLHQVSSRILQSYLEGSSSGDSPIRDSRAAREYIEKILLDRHTSSSLSSTSVDSPRPSTLKRPTLVTVGGISSAFILDSVYAISFCRGRCLPCAPLPVDSLTYFSAVAVNNTLIVTGGIRAGTIVPSVYRYSVEDNAWAEGRPMPQARARHASVALRGGHVFVFGGVTMTEVTPDARSPDTNVFEMADVPNLTLVHAIDRYNIEKDEWSSVGSCGNPRQMSSLAVVSPHNEDPPPEYSDAGFTIVELGGTLDVQSTRISHRMAIYRVEADLFVQASDDYIALPKPVRYAKCVSDTTGKLVHIFWESSGELSVLDLHRKSLRNLKALTSPHHTEDSSAARVHCGCVWVDNRLYVVGGFSAFVGATEQRPTNPRRSIHAYNPETDSWSDMSGLTEDGGAVPRAVCGCVSLDL